MRISTTSNSTLSSLITSKESDHELRAQALKRLAFTVLSSELDRYQSQVPEIQGELYSKPNFVMHLLKASKCPVIFNWLK